MNYPCSENKGADQLRGYRLLPMQIVDFPMCGSIIKASSLGSSENVHVFKGM